MTKQHSVLKSAALRWQDATPVSASFDDFYFSTDNGLEESRYVFQEANQLPERFQNGQLEQPFIIGETGFGTGLNFISTWQSWLELEQPKRPLHFFSIEKYPLSKNDLAQALKNWPELDACIPVFLAAYPALVQGLHTLDFEQGQVRLSLLFDDVHELSHHLFQADTWFLDGFSPQKNPDMWTSELFEEIARHSKNGATFSTFTAASDIRKRLQHAGFHIQKRVGFGVKREMLCGEYHAVSPQTVQQKSHWSLPNPDDRVSLKNIKPSTDYATSYDVAIIGAGLAGLATAYELSQQGLTVCLIDGESAPVQGASGQTQLAMYSKLPSEANKLFHFIIHALGDSFRFYSQLQNKCNAAELANFWHPSGLMQLAWNSKEQRKQQRFLENIHLPEEITCKIDSLTASRLSGLNITCDALWFEQAGWLNPVNYAQALLSYLQIDCRYHYSVNHLDYQLDTQHWCLNRSDAQDRIYARSVVIANANEAKRFAQCAHLPTKPLRGQVTSIKHEALQGTKTVVCGEGYLCPSHDQWHHFGATFDLKSQQALIKQSDAQENIYTLQKWLPGWLDNATVNEAQFQHSAGLRCTTPDYLPIVGPAPIADKMMSSFSKLREDANACRDQYGHYYPNLYINIGHGSKGLFTSPLAAKIIRHYICGGLASCSEDHRVMLSPSRFLIKHLAQRRI